MMAANEKYQDLDAKAGVNGDSKIRPTNGQKQTVPKNSWTHTPLIPPIYHTTTFENFEPGHANYEYSRGTNPTRDTLQEALAKLELAQHALVFSSGLGTLTTCMFLLESGDHILCCDDVYGGTHRWFSQCGPKMGLETTFVDGTNSDDWTSNFRPNETKLIWIESPTNPTMKIVDIVNISKRMKAMDPNCLVVVDNTFMSPVLLNPLALGADIVMHSVTKYINGHSDVIMGCIMTNNRGLYEKLKFLQNALGIVPSPWDCSMVIRSIKTLEIRVRRQSESALKIARYLEKEPRVLKVLYSGLESHPQHHLAKKHYKAFGGMISFYLKERFPDDAILFCQTLSKFHTAVSLGCVHSLIEIPSKMTHSAVPQAHLDKLQISNNLLRLSIGLDDANILIEDLRRAFQACS